MSLMRENYKLYKLVKTFGKQKEEEDETQENELTTSFASAIDNSLGTNCTRLPNGITEIREGAFNGCTNLALTELPDSVITIGEEAFNKCTNLVLTELPKEVTTIGNGAFMNCKNLALTKLPKEITQIGTSGFYNCEKITVSELPQSLTAINHGTFQGCKGLTLTELPEGIVSIDNYGFYDCTNLALTKLPSGLTRIGEKAFYHCTNLALTELPEGVTYIFSQTFCECTSITSLCIKGALTGIANYAFQSCSNFRELIMPNITQIPSLASQYALLFTSIYNGEGYIYVPDDLVDSFKTATNWSVYADQIRGISELGIKSMEINTIDKLNIYNGIKNIQIDSITYNNGDPGLYYKEQEGYVLSVSENATINNDGLIILNENVQVGDIVTITATSTYDSNIIATKNIEITSIETILSVNLNDKWHETNKFIDGHVIYQSSIYGVANGEAVATITVQGYYKVKIYITYDAENNYDYIEAFAVDTPAVRGEGLFTGEDSNGSYTECVYELDGGLHTIDIMFSKDSSGNYGDDWGRFYIGECN